MSKVASLSYKKSQQLLKSLCDQQRQSLGTGFESANILLSPKYRLRDKDLRKIHKAARVGDAARVRQLLLGKCGVNDRDKKKRTALHIACAYGHPKVVMALIEGKCEIDAIDNDKCTGLVKAIQCQEEDCATILLENGADPNIVDALGNSALHYAVYYKNTSLAAKLLENEVNIEVINKSGFTPFLLAVSENKLKMAKFLLTKNANIHATDNQKRTALMHAVSHDSTNLVRFVLQQGVDLFLKDAFGLTAIDYAADFKYDTNMEILLEYKEKRSEESERANIVKKSSEDVSSRSVSIMEEESGHIKLKGRTASIQSDSLLPSSSSNLNEGPTEPGIEKNGKAEPAGGVTPVEEPRKFDNQGNDQDQEGLAEPETGREEQEPAGGVTPVEEPLLDGRGNDQHQEGATEPRTSKEEQDMTCTLVTEKVDEDESSWDSESVSESLPLIRIGVDGMLQVNGQAVENPEKYLHWLPNRKRKDFVPEQMKGVEDAQAFISAEPGLVLTSEEKHKGLARNEEKQHQVEEERKQGMNDGGASENLCAAALDHGDGESPLTWKNGKPGSQQIPSADNKEQDGSPAFNIKEEKKRGHEKWSSGDFVTALTSEESELAADLLRAKDTWSLNDSNPNKGRPAKENSKETHKVRREMNAMEDTDDLTQPPGLCSEDNGQKKVPDLITGSEPPCSCRKLNSGPLEEQPVFLTSEPSLQPILCPEADLCSNRQQTETENEPCELLTRKTGNMEHGVVEEKVMKTEPVRSREKKENKRMKSQLPGKDGLYTGDTENQHYGMALGILHMKAKQIWDQLQEAQDQQREAVQSSQKMQDLMQKLQAECSEAEVIIQEQGKKIAELWKLHAGLARDKEEQLKKVNKIMSSLKCSLDQKKNKNEELEREFTEIKKHLGVMRKKLNDRENGEFRCHRDLKTKELEVNISMDMLKNEIHELKEKWGTINAKYLPLNVQFKYIEQELLSIKIAQTLYEKLQKEEKILERDALDLQHQLQENMAKSEDKNHAMALRDSNNDSVMSQMELRIKSLEAELEKMQAERESDAKKVEKYKQRYVKERELSKMLSQKLNKTNSKLSKVRTDILLLTEQNRAMQSALSAWPVIECPSVTKHSTCVKCNPSFIPSRNPEPSIPSPQPSESMRRSLLKKQQKMVKDIAEEVDKATAELECWSLEAYPSGFK